MLARAADDPVARQRALDRAIRSTPASIVANNSDPCPVKPLTTPVTVQGALTTSSGIDPVINTREDVYSVTGTAGQAFTVDYSSSAYDTYFVAYGDQAQNNFDLCFSNFNTYIINPGDVSRTKASCTFKQTGTYFIHAESLWNASDTGHTTTGPYTLVVNGGSAIANPSIVTFTASPATIRLGQSATLSWVTTNATSVPITATFSENVSGFASSDITATNATAGSVSGSGSVYAFSLMPTSSGTSNTSFSSRSYRSDQIGKSVLAAISGVLMRSRAPARRRLPVRT